MIRAENLTKTYDRGTRRAHEVLHGLSFTLPDTGFVCILGASGCGKTSLLNAVGGLDHFDDGTVSVGGGEPLRSGSAGMERERNASFGYIFQNYYLLAEHSAAYNVYIGMHSLALPHREKMRRVRQALERVDMLRFRRRPVGELSGGQQQRVAIARAIARRPKVIFADEPTGNLDEANTLNICTILKELSRESLIVMVTHETRIARFFADRIITLEDGRILSDTEEWDRGSMDAGAQNTLYAGDYAEGTLAAPQLSVRVLYAEDAPPAALTVVVEAERIVIKTQDNRMVLCSSAADVPFLEEGKRPVIDRDSFAGETPPTVGEPQESVSLPSRRGGLGLRMLLREAFSQSSGKKLRKFGTGVFLVLLSLLLSLAAADFVTLSTIDPRQFGTVDSHTTTLRFERGPSLETDKYTWFLNDGIRSYLEYLEGEGLSFDCIPKTANEIFYHTRVFPQIGALTMPLTTYSTVNISRFDETTLVSGRMPQAYNEIVVDRWVLDVCFGQEGVLQNFMVSPENMLGETLWCDRRNLRLTVVGICDSGEPSVYMSTEALLSLGSYGMETITLSEFCALTGMELAPLAEGECIVIIPNIGSNYLSKVGTSVLTKSGYDLFIREAIEGQWELYWPQGIYAQYVVSDETRDGLYRAMITSLKSFDLWCADKPAVLEAIAAAPEELTKQVTVNVRDVYQEAYDKYTEQVALKVDARTIVTAAVILLCLVMLYLMQRARIRERMDLIAVYRLLGIPKRDLVTIFTAESLLLTLRYALPVVGLTWLVIRCLDLFGIGTVLIFPLWTAALTLGVIAAVRVLVAVLPVLRLLRLPPAQLAAKYDF